MKIWPLFAVLAFAAPAMAQEKPFTREDYVRYFAPGELASKSIYYTSEGRLEIIANRETSFGGRQFLMQTTETFDVSPNYDLSSKFPFYKIRSRSTEPMLWDEARQLWIYDYSEKKFDSDKSQVWESMDTEPSISPGDKAQGLMHKFYNDADRRSGGNVAANEAAYRKSAIGAWTWSCTWLRGQIYDVRCKAIHQPTQRIEDFSYRRLDQIS